MSPVDRARHNLAVKRTAVITAEKNLSRAIAERDLAEEELVAAEVADIPAGFVEGQVAFMRDALANRGDL